MKNIDSLTNETNNKIEKEAVVNQPKDIVVDQPVDPIVERKTKILAIARSQGIPITEGLDVASEEELKKLQDVLSAIKIMADNTEDQTKTFTLAINALEGAKIIRGSGNLFNEYVVNAVRKSYNNFLEIKNQKEPLASNWELFKGTVQLAADTFFALKTFRTEAHKKYPGLMALEVTLATASASTVAAPIALAIGTFYTACKGISTVLDFAGYEDNTLKLIEGGKELKAQAQQALADKKIVEKDQGGVTLETLAAAFKVFEEKGIISAIASISLSPTNLEKIAEQFKNMTGQTEENSKKFMDALGSAMNEIPKNNADVLNFIKILAPEGVDLGPKGQEHFNKFTTKLTEIEDGIPDIRRLAGTIAAMDMLTKELKKDGIELPSALTNLTSKMIEVGKSIVPTTEKIGAAIGGVQSLKLVTSRISTTMQTTKDQSMSPAK